MFYSQLICSCILLRGTLAKQISKYQAQHRAWRDLWERQRECLAKRCQGFLRRHFKLSRLPRSRNSTSKVLASKASNFERKWAKKVHSFVHSLTASLWTCIACRNRTLWFQSYLQQLSLVTYSLENKLAAESDWESDYLKSSIPWLKVWNLQDWIGTGVMRFLLITQRWNQCAKEMAWK